MTAIREAQAEMKAKQARITVRFDKQFDIITTKLDYITAVLEGYGDIFARFRRIDIRLNTIEKYLGILEAGQRAIETRLGAVEDS